MSSASNNSNRDDADCMVSATWNNGKLVRGSTLSGLSLPDGNSTKQCTEISWSIDTSQALPGTTYRFMIAIKDSFRPDKGVWRGPVSVATDAYPALTIMGSLDQSYKYSKDILGPYTNNNCGASGSTDWSCADISDRASNISTAFSQDGTPYISYQNGLYGALYLAKYVGGVGCGASFSTAWTCTTVDYKSGYIVGDNSSLSFDPAGIPYISYYDSSNTASTNTALKVAKYVGTGGTGCNDSGNDKWTCTVVDNDTDDTGDFSDLAFSQNGLLLSAIMTLRLQP